MNELTFTEYCQKKIKDINVQELADTANVVGVGAHISELAQLMTRVNTELATRIFLYSTNLNMVLEEEKISVALARVKVDASKEAQDLLQCKLLKESIIEMLRSLKYLAKSMGEEYSVSQHT